MQNGLLVTNFNFSIFNVIETVKENLSTNIIYHL